MKKQNYITILLFVCFSKFSSAQILCIYCYNQNTPISTGVNNLLLNGGFENSTCVPNYNYSTFCPNSQHYSCDIVDWTCTGGGDSTYSSIWNNNLTIIPEGNYAVYFGSNYCLACTSGDTSCLNNIDCTVSGIPLGYPLNTPSFGGTSGVSLEQTVTGLITGNTYVLEFWAGGEFGYSASGLFAFDIGFGDTLLRDKPTPTISGIGTRYIIEFNAISSSHTIKFTNWGHISYDCTELILDDVQLYTLSELSASVPHCALGINDVLISQNMISIFPNPVTNKLNVKTNRTELSEIILYDIASRKIVQQKFINSISLNTEQLAKGLYLYEVQDRNGLCKKGKVVKD